MPGQHSRLQSFVVHECIQYACKVKHTVERVAKYPSIASRTMAIAPFRFLARSRGSSPSHRDGNSSVMMATRFHDEDGRDHAKPA